MRPTHFAPRARPSSVRARHLGFAVLAGFAALLLTLTGCTRAGGGGNFQTTDITDHFPDLRFDLATAGNPHLTAKDFRGNVVLVYFGYTHCPDVCPLTLSRLASIVKGLGPEAAKVKILFISVDPKRDTPEAVQTYASAFSPRAVGATGTPAEIQTLARRYRVAYQAEAPTKGGSYEVMHSKAIYVFDEKGHARLFLSDTDTNQAVTHDLRELVASS